MLSICYHYAMSKSKLDIETILTMLGNTGSSAALHVQETIDSCAGDQDLILSDLDELIKWAQWARREISR